MTNQGFEFLNNQIELLRQESVHLKNCQLRYYTITLVTIATIFGVTESELLIGEADENSHQRASLFLVPLLVIVPNWTFFFDKAKSISRIVGYIRKVEKLITGTSESGKFISWEVGLGNFRDADNGLEDLKTKQGAKSSVFAAFCVFLFRTRQKYWVLNYHMYFIGSALCLTFSYQNQADPIYQIVWSAASAVSVIAALYNAIVLTRLTRGRYTYRAAEEQWEEIAKMHGKELPD